MSSDAVSPAVTRGRFVLVLWLCGLSSILYLDRICMSQAVKPIQEELDLTNTQMSYVMMAFLAAYGLFEIPTGHLGDRFGSRGVITRIVLWWSVFTALTGACFGFIPLLLVRFLFGAGEAGAFPNTARVIDAWFPFRERGRVQGVMLSCAQFGAVISPVATAVLIATVGWRWTFPIFGLLGVAWAIGFWWWFREDPADHPSVSEAELAVIRDDAPPPKSCDDPIPWGIAFTNRGVLTLMALAMLGSFYTYFFYSWFPKYLSSARGLNNSETGTLASIVLAGSAVGMLTGGWLADRLPRWVGDAVVAKRYLGMSCFSISAACLFFGIRMDDPMALAGLWGASFCFMHISLPNWWATAVMQSGRHVGALCGLMNGIGVVGGMASQWFVGVYSDRQAARGFTGREQWDPLFDVYVIVLLLGAVAWWWFRYRPLADAQR